MHTYHMAQGLYMEFYFWFSGRTVQSEVHELDGKIKFVFLNQTLSPFFNQLLHTILWKILCEIILLLKIFKRKVFVVFPSTHKNILTLNQNHYLTVQLLSL